MRGEAVRRAEPLVFIPGPSPRARGSRRRLGCVPASRGSIPACAGKPTSACRQAASLRVHPRVRGEAGHEGISSLIAPMGPSPRARGSHDPRPLHTGERGSIPACAGKPSTHFDKKPLTAVHPRVRGEAPGSRATRRNLQGPSPRARGSLLLDCYRMPHPGSIPACAGKPVCTAQRSRTSWVHPRVRGEADWRGMGTAANQGPSPRARGSPVLAASTERLPGSIPACAGKPGEEKVYRTLDKVHPRVRGEA